MPKRLTAPDLDGAVILAGCLALLVVALLSALFWGWVIMLVAGAVGWNIGYLPACGLGFLVGLLTRPPVNVERR